ncbi:PQQ-dependent dehydrogenase, methanol/ethanol family [Paremcibacter congregatus]|uniref:PQQ-dependent dehydrogenase, methanol/ethanol family n=1 Tax=Paremcibacter congregatus TaxID=2043170 RepID=A0A2G4YS79_9PROT|nr:PQQ-dependent dehydrogenase, methanol/ethanol family [Paremcibacter congregatus]PHZ85178.1 PQQ-dependent dehydrogenase, methanol/ethanol family [Paremcibacter congregatus]QDE27886.1 PQQ-dependent dehydrogenase, methanol/ethanol family [Paremcibacter congregatus]
MRVLITFLVLFFGTWSQGFCFDRENPALSPGAIDSERLRHIAQEPGEWLTVGRDFGETHYSPLTLINDQNVDRLGFAWQYDTDTHRGLEATPIFVDGVLYVTGNWGIVYAIDGKTGQEIWTFDPEVPGRWARNACCDVVSRGLSVWKGKVYAASLDGRLFALNATNGAVIWQTDTFVDRSRPYTITGAPRIAGKNVVIGNGGAEYGVRGYVSAFDLDTGKLAWRFYTVPGDPKKPFEHPELEMASKTWDPDSRWDVGGGGTAWDAMVYDPDLNLLYVGTGNGSPWVQAERSPGGGDNLFLSSILAINPDTGRLAWHYQTTPGDNWDYTSTQPIILTDLEFKGKQRKVLMQAPKNGFFYVLDRETGELLSAEKYATVTWASHVDMKTGKPQILEQANYDAERKLILPSPAGAHNWQPMAYNPNTGLVYIPAMNDPAIYERRKRFTYIKGINNQGAHFSEGTITSELGHVSEEEAGGFLLAWDPVKGKPAWRHKLGHFIFHGGVLTTAGNLVVQARDDGLLVVYAADTGKVLHQIQTGSSILAAPLSYTIDGEQYIAVMAGYGGGPFGYFPVGSAVEKYGNEGRLLAFKLGGTAVPLPEELPPLGPLPKPPVGQTVSAEVLAEGKNLFTKACGECHWNINGGYPDLRRMSPEVHASFQDIVWGGEREALGMAGFGDILSKEQVEAIHAYLIKLSYEAYHAQTEENKK